MDKWLAEVITSDNRGDPLVEWLREYLGSCAANMLLYPELCRQCGFAVSKRNYSKDNREDIFWYRTWVSSPYLYHDGSGSSSCRIEHPAVVGASLNCTRVMIPVAIYHRSFHTNHLLQTWWWYVKWRLCSQTTDVVKIVEFDPDQKDPIIWNVSYGTLYTWIRAVQRSRHDLSNPTATTWPTGRCPWTPSHDQLNYLIDVVEFSPTGAESHHQNFPVWHTDMRKWPMFAVSS